MPTFLLKTEPDDYAYDDLVRDKRTIWDGIRNNGALLHVRAMRKGDEALIYHTGKERCITGLAKVVSNPYEDPANPGANARGEPKWAVVDIVPKKIVEVRVTLAKIKADARFSDFALVRQGRLSAMLVPDPLDKVLRSLAGL